MEKELQSQSQDDIHILLPDVKSYPAHWLTVRMLATQAGWPTF
jgi:hypothetical protein